MPYAFTLKNILLKVKAVYYTESYCLGGHTGNVLGIVVVS